MLILQGERDYQVTMDDFSKWRRALGERSNVKFKSYPGLNHLFMDGTGPSRASEYLKPSHKARSSGGHRHLDTEHGKP